MKATFGTPRRPHMPSSPRRRGSSKHWQWRQGCRGNGVLDSRLRESFAEIIDFVTPDKRGEDPGSRSALAAIPDNPAGFRDDVLPSNPS